MAMEGNVSRDEQRVESIRREERLARRWRAERVHHAHQAKMMAAGAALCVVWLVLLTLLPKVVQVSGLFGTVRSVAMWIVAGALLVTAMRCGLCLRTSAAATDEAITHRDRAAKA